MLSTGLHSEFQRYRNGRKLAICSQPIDPESLQRLLQSLQDIPGTTELTFENLLLGAEEAKLLGDFLVADTTVVTLNLRNNRIGNEGAKALATALEKNHTLTKLGLFNNKIKLDGATALATALEKNHTLTSLNLSANQIGNEGAKALASALEKNTSLIKLDIASNLINSKGAEALAEALKTNTRLTHLYLAHNAINQESKHPRSLRADEGVTALAAMLEKNKTLTTLNLAQVPINEVGLKQLAEALKHNRALTELTLLSNPEGHALILQCTSATKRNSFLAKKDRDAKQSHTDFTDLTPPILNAYVTSHVDLLLHQDANPSLISPAAVWMMLEHDPLSQMIRKALRKGFSIADNQQETGPYGNPHPLAKMADSVLPMKEGGLQRMSLDSILSDRSEFVDWIVRECHKGQNNFSIGSLGLCYKNYCDETRSTTAQTVSADAVPPLSYTARLAASRAASPDSSHTLSTQI